MIDDGTLWRKRAGLFWREILPYFRYVFSSGLALFLLVLFIITVNYYANFIDHIPDNFPVNWIAVVTLLPTLAFSPVRTFFRRADIVFLLPAEHRLQRYISQTLWLSVIVQSILTLVVWLVVWPLYRVTEGVGTSMFVLLLAVLLVMKWTNVYGRWQEQHLQYDRTRTLIMTVRWLGMAVLLYILFTYEPIRAVIIIGLALLAYVLALCLPAKFTMHWDQLIKVEEQQRAKYYAFLSWFIDMPQYERKAVQRRYLNWATNMLKFQQSNAYRYLYLKTFLRSDIFSMVVRLLIIGFIAIFFVENELVKGFLFLFFSYVIGVQLATLEQHHRYSFWLQIYPLSDAMRRKAVLRLARTIHAVAMIILYAAAWLSLGLELMALYVLGVGILLWFGYHIKRARMIVE